MVLTKLVFSNLKVHKTRFALTVAAVALSVSLVVSVTSGYSSAEAAAHQFLSQLVGTTDAMISRRADGGAIAEALLNEIARDPDVEHVDGQLEISSPLIDSAGNPIIGIPAQIRGIRRPDDRRVDRLRLQEGKWFDSADGNFAVIDQVAKEKLKLNIGDTFTLPGIEGKLPLKVVGVIHKPGIFASQLQSVYLPLRTLQEFALPKNPRQLSSLFIQLKRGADERAFAERLRPKLSQIDPLLRLRLSSESRKEMEKNLEGLRVLSYLGGTVSMLAATFIVFSSLSMGVSERQRSLAMVRAIGAFKTQLAQLVFIEGAIVSATGAVVGVVLGIGFIHILAAKFSEIFTAGVSLSWGGVAFAAGGSIFAALLASALPAWSATRVDPLEALSPLATSPKSKIPWPFALAGLCLIAIDPVLAFGPIERFATPQVAKSISFIGHFLVGLPCLMLGFFLLAPLFVWIVERVLGPVVAALFNLRFSLLRQQLSGGVWRAAGTSAALMVGLAILVVMHTQGHTAVAGWQLPNKFPDVFITSYQPGGLDLKAQQKIASVPGIKSDEVMPILYSPSQLIKAFFSFRGPELMPDATLFIGVDPDKAFKLMELNFLDDQGRQVEGAERQRLADLAAEKLRAGRHIVVTNEFRELRKLKRGDTMTLITPKAGEVQYTIAGVVWSPGIDVFVSYFDLGQQMEQRTAASVFGSLDDARKDFGLEGAYLFAANLEPGIEKQELVKRINSSVAAMGLAAHDVRQIKFEIQQGLERLLLLVSTIAFAAMAVASLGVTNTIMASVRSRRWQFGILRSVGVTRGGLLRLVLAEAILLGTVGCVMGLCAGFEMSINARQIWGLLIGYKPPMQVPWDIVLVGTAVVMSIALLASIIPALHVARSEPLALLQAGRATG